VFELSLGAAAICIAIVYLGASVQGSLGIGLGMISSPVLALVDPDFIPAAIVLSVIPLSGTVAWAERAHIERRGVGLALGGRVPGVIIGAFTAAWFSDDALGLLVAASVLIAVVVSLAGVKLAQCDSTVVAAGFASGFMGTTTGVGGPPVALAYQHSDPVTMRATVSAFFVVGALMSVMALTLAGEIGTRQLQLAALILPSVLIGLITARRVSKHLDPTVVRPAVLALCSASAIALLIKTFI
jgi:uncharacterized membrane protein YfcA